MGRRKKIVLLLAGGAGFAVLLLGTAFILASAFLHTPSVREKIESALSHIVNGTVTFQRIDLALFPRPHAVIVQTSLVIQKAAAGTIKSVSLYPQLGELFKGNIYLSKLEIDEPEFTLFLREEAGAQKPGSASGEELHAAIRSALAPLEAIGPGSVLRINKGRLDLFRGNSPVLSLKNVDARFSAPPGAVEFMVKADAGPWGAASLRGTFSFSDEKAEVTGLSVALGQSALSGLSARVAFGKIPRLEVFSGQAVVSLDEVYHQLSSTQGARQLAKDVAALKGTVKLSSLKVSGPLSRPAAWNLSMTGVVQDFAMEASFLPGPVSVVQGRFDLVRDRLSFSDVHAAALGSSFTFSGSLQGLPHAIRAVDLTFEGRAEQKFLQWVYKTFSLPQELMVRAPLAISRAHASWRQRGGLSLAGSAIVAHGPAVALDLSLAPGELVLRRAAITDRDSRAFLAFTRREKVVDLSFSGKLAQKTLDRIFANQPFGQGMLEGKFSAAVPVDRLQDSTAQGIVSGDDLIIPWGLAVPLKVDRFSLHADKNTLFIDSLAATWGDSHFSLAGSATASAEGFVLDMDLSSDSIDIDHIQEALKAGKRKNAGIHAIALKPSVRGTVRFNAPSVTYGRYRISPARAVVTIGPGGVNASITEAGFCGISLPGTFALGRGVLGLDLKPAAAKQPLESAIPCLSGEKVNMTGTFDLKSSISMRGKRGALLPSLEGRVEFKAKDGKIYRYPLLAKIFSVLSVTEILRGKLPELGGSGFEYHSVSIKGKLHQGKMTLEEALLDGSSVDLIAEGEVDLAAKKADLVVLVAPFATVNWAIRHIPLVGKILGGTIISVPVKVSGDLDDPDVTVLSPSAVGTRLLETLKNIVELPVEIISPFLPHEKEQQ